MEISNIGNANSFDINGNNKIAGYKVTQVKNERMAGFITSYSNIDNEESFDSALSSFAPEKNEGTKIISKEDSFGFFDLIDMINPLQHIPLLNIAYQKITGDTIKPISRIIGGTIFGGPMGAASGLITAAIEDGTGKTPLDNAISLISNKDSDIKAYNELPPEMLSLSKIPSINDSDRYNS